MTFNETTGVFLARIEVQSRVLIFDLAPIVSLLDARKMSALPIGMVKGKYFSEPSVRLLIHSSQLGVRLLFLIYYQIKERDYYLIKKEVKVQSKIHLKQILY